MWERNHCRTLVFFNKISSRGSSRRYFHCACAPPLPSPVPPWPCAPLALCPPFCALLHALFILKLFSFRNVLDLTLFLSEPTQRTVGFALVLAPPRWGTGRVSSTKPVAVSARERDWLAFPYLDRIPSEGPAVSGARYSPRAPSVEQSCGDLRLAAPHLAFGSSKDMNE